MAHSNALQESPAGLFCAEGEFHIDPWHGVPRAVITHAHGDHARAGSAVYLCADECAPLLTRRFGADAVVESVAYGTSVTLGSVRVSFHPAGHILGSAQVRIEGPEGVWVVSGDYKLAVDPTCAPFEVVPCDTFVTESTFGLPIYRWDPTETVITEILEWWEHNTRQSVASVLFCYTLGKAQRLLAELARVTDRPVFVHGMMSATIEAYRLAGIPMLPTIPLIEKPRGTSFEGELVLAPLSARGTPHGRLAAECDLVRIRAIARRHERRPLQAVPLLFGVAVRRRAVRPHGVAGRVEVGWHSRTGRQTRRAAPRLVAR